MTGLRRTQTTTGGVADSPRYNTGIGTNPRLAGSPPGPRLGSAPLSKQALDARPVVVVVVVVFVVAGA
jgi:hypothetical protein